MAKKPQREINSFKKNDSYSGNKYTNDNYFGYINIEKIRNKTWEIHNISIEEKYRKSGLGEKLVKAAFKFMKKHGATGVILNSPVEEAIGFWNKLGFKDINKRMKL